MPFDACILSVRFQIGFAMCGDDSHSPLFPTSRSEDRTLGKWLQQEIVAGRQVLPNDPLLVMNPMASPLVGNCLVVLAVIFPSLVS